MCLTFLHKTVQEFLVAINISCKEDSCNIFLDSLNTLDDVFQNEKIIMFVAGISTSHCQMIFEKIYEICDKVMELDRKYLVYDLDIAGCDMPNLCKLYRDCIRESCGEAISLKLHSLSVDHNEDQSVLHSLMNPSYVKTYLIKCLILTDSDLGFTTLDFSEFTSLTGLSFENVTMKGKLLLSKCTQFKCVKLAGCNFDDATLDLSECTSLTEVSLEDVTINVKLSLSKCTQLQFLNLNFSNLDDATLDLSECTSLTKLRLVCVTMKGKQFLSKCTQLKCVDLAGCNFDDATLDLSECTSLTELSLECVIMKGKLLLSKCTQLKCLNLTSCNFDDATLDLSECTSLTELSLQDMTMIDKLLLSKCTQLKCVNLIQFRFDDATLDLSECTSLTELSLYRVTMKGKLLLSKCTKLKFVKLVQCNFDDATLDLSECTSLSELRLDGVIMKGKLLLSKCTQFKYLNLCSSYLQFSICDLRKSKLEFTTFDLSECTSLTELSLEEVTMKGKLLLSKCTQLTCLYLVKCNFDDATLDLSECTSLTELSLEEETMTGKPLLSRYIHLNRLNLDYSDLHQTDELHELYSMDRLNCIAHDNVEMCKISSILMCYSLLQCTKLQKLSLKNIDLGDGLLSLKSLNQLKELTLNNITMCKESVEMCNSLSQFKGLRTLSLKNLDLSDGLISLKCHSKLVELTLDNIIMHKYRMEMLCNSISWCTQLEKLSMMNLNLGDGLLSLSSLNQLEEVTHDNITMSKDSVEMLCNSLSHCKGLTTLSLKNLDLNDGLLRLDNKEELYFLIIDNVTMCKYGYVMLCNSLSQCKGLRTLSLKNLDLNDGLLSLDKMKELYDFTVNNVTMCKDGYMMLSNSMSKCTKLEHLELRKWDRNNSVSMLNNLCVITCLI